MHEMPQALHDYLAMWNERDMDAMRTLLDRAVSEDMIFADPAQYHEGRDRLSRNVTKFRSRFPDADLSLASGVDSQHQRHRYAWKIEVSGELLIEGFDVTTINDEGQIERVDGFFGPLPPLED